MSTDLDLSIVIPVFNEEACVRGTVVEIIECLSRSGVSHEVVAVNNGSTDGTAGILDQLRSELPTLVVLPLAVNEGYGGGIVAGWRRCRGRVIGFTCADGEVGATDLVTMFRVLEAGALDVCKGKRIHRHDGPFRQFMSFGYHIIVGLLFRIHITDVNGYPLVMRRENLSALDLRQRNWVFNVEVLFGARNLGLTIAEVDVEHRPRAGGRSHVRWYYPFLFLWQLLVYWRRSRGRAAEAPTRAA